MTRGLLSILFLILAGGIFFFYTKPTYDGVKSQQAQVSQYNQALDKAAELQALKQQLISRYNAFNPNDIVRLQKLLPDHVDNIALILDLNSLAAQHGMIFENVDVTSTGQAGNKQDVSTATIGSDEQKYDSLTLKFATYGTYDAFAGFLRDLEASLRVVDLVGLNISTAGGDAASAGAGRIYQYDITIKTYWLK